VGGTKVLGRHTHCGPRANLEVVDEKMNVVAANIDCGVVCGFGVVSNYYDV